MTGRQIRALREAIKIDPFALAGVLGVHVSTIYRWEATAGTVRMDSIQAQIIAAAQARIDERGMADAMHDAIVNGLVRGGTLHALHALLRVLMRG